MNIGLLIGILAAAIGTASQAADGITTYIGVKKFGPTIEGDKSAFVQWMVRHPWTLPWLKPLGFALGCTSLLWAGPRSFLGPQGSIVLTVLFSIVTAIYSTNVVLGNIAANNKKS